MTNKLHELYQKDKVLFLSFLLIMIPLLVMLVFLLGQFFLFTYFDRNFIDMALFSKLMFPAMMAIILGWAILEFKSPRKTRVERSDGGVETKGEYGSYSSQPLIVREHSADYGEASKKEWQNTGHLDTSEESREEILEALKLNGVNLPCPRCSNSDFSLLEGYFLQPLIQKDTDIGQFATLPQIPSVVIMCNKCGYLSQHATEKLDFKKK